ncbi:MAG: hypothetical protein KF778_08135 [Rhodocyclaceae bacterium]|nr:hypothetical protein [Rhodocyclaceae bacterium]MBX3668358.1 hypothetical protein [Rhodocyclaceae bacterium]
MPADLATRLSPHFTLAEFLRSDTAERKPEWVEAQYNPGEAVIGSLSFLVATALEPIRSTFGYPMRISSGYRSPPVNAAVGGTSTSQHLLGQAADCQIDDGFLTAPDFDSLRERIRARIRERTGRPARDDLNANFYLFAYVVLRIDDFGIDQVIHEYGLGAGRPAWVHIAASAGPPKAARTMGLGNKLSKTGALTVTEALALGT